MTKEHILSEIRRTATADGRALGAGQFERVTGIRNADWKGKYWARWGDAVNEAGFERNEPPVPYTDDQLLAHLATAAQELGHFPTQPEMRLRTRNGGKFPSVTTYREQFGGRPELMGRLRSYAIKNGLPLVAEMCGDVRADESEVDPSAAEAGEKAQPEGHVYLMKSGQYYKLGRTNELGRRGREIVTELPQPTQVIHSIATDDASGIEAYWHNRFRDRRQNGEWFALTADDVRAFRRRKFM